jgi:hypothetical protein
MRGLSALAALLLLAPGAAMAAPVKWECDTAAGAYSELSQVQPGPAYRVRGTMKWAQSRVDRHYAPSAQVRIDNAGATRWVGVQMLAAPRAARISLGVRLHNGGETQDVALGTAGLNEVVPFEISVSPAGEIALSIGTERRTAQVDIGPGATVSAVCSTGEFEFATIDLGG